MKSMPTILFITQEFTLGSGTSGGAGVYAYELTKALAAAGSQVHVMAPGRSTRTQILHPNLTIHWQKTVFMPLLLMPTFQLQVLHRARRLIKTYRIDSIHGNDYAAGLVLRLRPSIAMIHHPVSSEMATTTTAQRLLNLPDLLLEKHIAKHANLITVPSHLVKDLLAPIYPTVASKVHVTLNGVDLAMFTARGDNQVRRRHQLSATDVVAFYPGGARAKRKGGLTLVAALAKAELTRPLHILISGSSREAGWAQELRTAISQAGLESTFIWVGELSYDSLPEYIEAADFTVYPSLFEGFGLPVLESLAVGRPVISTRTGEIQYLISEHTGILTDPGDSDQLAAAISKLVDNAPLRERLGQAARASIASTASWDTAATTVLALHRQVVSAHTRKSQ